MDSISLAASMLKAYYGANETKLAFNKKKLPHANQSVFKKVHLKNGPTMTNIILNKRNDQDRTSPK